VERNLDDLRIEARYWRERYSLYRAKTYGPRPTTPARLNELERTAQAAEARLRHAEAAKRSTAPFPGPG
jgi:hypothetical protein